MELLGSLLLLAVENTFHGRPAPGAGTALHHCISSWDSPVAGTVLCVGVTSIL